MLRKIIRQRSQQMALARDPKTATYSVRIASNTTGGADTFTTYKLSRVNYRPADQNDLALLNVVASYQYLVWVIYRSELLAVGAPLLPLGVPSPQESYELTVDGQTWVMENVKTTALNQIFECVSYLAR